MCHIFRPLFYVPSHYPCRIFHQEQLLTHPSNLELLPLVKSEMVFSFCAKQKYYSQGLGETRLFNEEQYYAGRLIRDCVSTSLGARSRLSCTLSVIYLWVLSTRLTKDSKLIMFPIHNSLRCWTPAISKPGPIFCKRSI